MKVGGGRWPPYCDGKSMSRPGDAWNVRTRTDSQEKPRLAAEGRGRTAHGECLLHTRSVAPFKLRRTWKSALRTHAGGGAVWFVTRGNVEYVLKRVFERVLVLFAFEGNADI